MVHRKKKHLNKINKCQRFLAGSCNFEDDACWYQHKQKDTGNRLEGELIRIKCNTCDKVFETKFELMHHRKREHIQEVPQCTKSKNGTCWFSAKTCWFHHEEIERMNDNGNDDKVRNNIYNEEMIGKMFNMMEVFTQRILKLENDKQMPNQQNTI